MQRLRILLILFLLIFVTITLRLFYWQIVRGEQLARAAIDQYYSTLEIPASRGEIVAQNGDPLVINKVAYLVYAEPKKISDKNEFATKVAPLLNMEATEIESRLSPENLVWVLLKQKIQEDEYVQLIDLNLEGLGFEKIGTRFYPEASMAGQLVGFVGSDSTGADKGYFGLEGHYDLALKGKTGSLVQENDARGLPILLGAGRRIPAENGQELTLHLDKSVQLIAEEQLLRGIEKYGAKEGLVAILDPKTGGLIASASFPNYDPSVYQQFGSEIYPNPLVADTYEPGSTFKALVMAAALNEKVVDPKTTFDEKGPTQIGEYLIRTWNNEYHGVISMAQVLERSSNPGMVFVGQKLGKDKLISYIKKFGFGEKTGIDLEEEAQAPLREDSDWKDIDIATASFGQGIAVTPLQMLRAVSVLANGGKLMEPQVVKKLTDTTGKKIDRKPKVIREVIRPAIAKQITEMMIGAVDNGEAKWAKPKGYRIAGKTGTAQIPVAGHYDNEKTIASFVGFAPADNPHFVMLVLLREPTTSPWGSETAAPLFFSIAKNLFSYYGISPTQ